MPDETKPFHNPFAALSGLHDRGPAADPVPDEAPPPPPAPGVPPRAVVRMERSGRGGKTVTVVGQLELSDEGRAAWLTALKGALGCGGVVEGTDLVVQGEHRARVAAWLRDRGVRKVIVG